MWSLPGHDHIRRGFSFDLILNSLYLFKVFFWLKSPKEAEPPTESSRHMQSHPDLSQDCTHQSTVGTFKIKALFIVVSLSCLSLSELHVCLSLSCLSLTCLSLICLSLTFLSVQSSPVEDRKSFPSVSSSIGSEPKLLIVWVEHFDDIGK